MKQSCCGRYAVGAILAVALVLRIAAAFWWQGRLEGPSSFQFGDSHTYWGLAGQIYEGKPYQYGSYDRIFRTPGYPLMLAGLFGLTGNDRVLPARLLGAMLGTLSIALLMILTRELFNTRSALLAGAVAAVYPGAIAMSILILSESPFCPWMIGQLWCWTRADRCESRRGQLAWGLAGGILAGVATLVRPSWLLFTPFAAGFAVVFFRNRTRQLLISTALIVGLCLTMLPWWLRNHQTAGRWVPTTLQVGASLYDGISPTATGASDMRFMPAFRTAQRNEDQETGRDEAGFELRLNNRLKQAAIDYAKQQPGAVVQLMAKKFVRMWSPFPNAGDLQSPLFRLVIAVSFIPLLLASIWGAASFARREWGYFLCLLPAVYFTCLHMIFVSSIRYRLPAMLVLTVLACGAIVSRWRRDGETPKSSSNPA